MTPSTDPIRSQYANDAEMAELVDMFVTEMPDRVQGLLSSWSEQKLDDVSRFAHQLKGACGGYGFPTLSSAAGELERTLHALADGSSQASTDELRAKFDELIRLCQRISR